MENKIEKIMVSLLFSKSFKSAFPASSIEIHPDEIDLV